ncbi:MAG: PKD domain-containing protein [Chthonomonas sp.]|nr:PKD domain-containing protein [Chthonomonas sp.]
MKTWTVIGSIALCAWAAAAPSVVLYSPTRTVKDQGVSLTGWGSGSIAETDEAAYEGTNSIRISTRNFFQGGRIVFANAVDFSEAAADPNNLLRVAVKLADSTQTMGGGPGARSGGPGASSTSGGGGMAGDEGAERGGGDPSGGVRGGPGSGSGTTTPATPTAFDQIRMIVTTSDGLKSEVFLKFGAAGENGWRMVSAPLQAISGFARTNKKVVEVAFSGNSVGTFYIGEVRSINDATPISGEPTFRERNIGLGEELQFSAIGYGGSSTLRYTWDFDSADGIQVDAEGQTVKRRFRKSGSYVVTVTISDLFGLKKPYSTTLNVKVN